MTTIGLNSGKRVWMGESPGRAVCPQTAVHLALNILYSEVEHDREAEVNGALEKERPAHAECSTVFASAPTSLGPGTHSRRSNPVENSDFSVFSKYNITVEVLKNPLQHKEKMI